MNNIIRKIKYAVYNSSFKISLVVALLLANSQQVFASPPPPGGVPIDSGVSLLIIAAIGYGAKKMKQDDNETF
jgi:hypothetical protein